MKKNLLSIVILALLIVNIVLTAIMMFSITGASKKTTALVTDIASVLQLELGGTAAEGGALKETVPLSQTDVYNMVEPLTVTLQSSEEKEHYCIVSIALRMNTKDKGYKTYGEAETMAGYQPLIAGTVNKVIGSYTIDDLRKDEVKEEARLEILKQIQELFDSQFIYDVSFSDIKLQ